MSNNVNKPVARFWSRAAGDEDGLFLGTTLNQKYFKTNTVYEIRETFGVLTIHEVGEGVCAVHKMGDPRNVTNTHISITLEEVMARLGKYLFLSKEEFNSIETY